MRIIVKRDRGHGCINILLADLAGNDDTGRYAADPHTAAHTSSGLSSGHILKFAHLLPPANRTGVHQISPVAVSVAIIGVNVRCGEVGGCQVHVKILQLSTF